MSNMQFDIAGEYWLQRVPLKKRQQQMSIVSETGDVLDADDLAASKRQSDIAGEYRPQRVPLEKRLQQMS